jgi:hypothetical protein
LRKPLTPGVLVVLLALVYVAGGCAMINRGPSDTDLLSELLHKYETALVEGNSDTLVSLYSESYESSDGTGYEEAMTRLRRIVPMIKEWDVKVDAAETQVHIEGDTATLSPIVFDTPAGGMTLTMFATKEAGGVWRITGSETESRR